MARPVAPSDSDRIERGAALVLRAWLLCLAAYIAFNKIFPFYLLTLPVAQMTGLDLLMLLLRTAIALALAAYLARKAFSPPPMTERHRIFCENWVGLGLGLTTLLAAASFVHLIEGDGLIATAARLMARSILWLLF